MKLGGIAIPSARGRDRPEPLASPRVCVSGETATLRTIACGEGPMRVTRHRPRCAPCAPTQPRRQHMAPPRRVTRSRRTLTASRSPRYRIQWHPSPVSAGARAVPSLAPSAWRRDTAGCELRAALRERPPALRSAEDRMPRALSHVAAGARPVPSLAPGAWRHDTARHDLRSALRWRPRAGMTGDHVPGPVTARSATQRALLQSKAVRYAV